MRAPAGWPVEIQMDDDAMRRIFWKPKRHRSNLISTTNQGDMPPLLLEMPEEQKRLPLREVERRLGALLTLHAIVHLLDTRRAAIHMAARDCLWAATTCWDRTNLNRRFVGRLTLPAMCVRDRCGWREPRGSSMQEGQQTRSAESLWHM